MTRSRSAALARLRAANPEAIDAARVHGADAQAALAQILDEPPPGVVRWKRLRRRFGGSSRRLIAVVAVVVVGGGAAFAATDPPGWWSATPTEARYGSNPAAHAKTPAAQQIGCTRSGRVLRCSPRPFGQLYIRLDTVTPPATSFTRRRVLAFMATARARGRMTASQETRVRADIAAVPDRFFAEFELASRYATYSTGSPNSKGETLVPPSGIPAFVVCERVSTGLSCQNLNGDEHVPIGAEIYGASAASDWREVRLRPDVPGRLPPGISFTPAEYRVLIDLLRFATVGRSSSVPKPVSGRPTRSP